VADPSPKDHREWATRNEEFYSQQLGGCDAKQADWGLTVLFYAAVHEVQAFLKEHRADIKPQVCAFLAGIRTESQSSRLSRDGRTLLRCTDSS
jgi:hypothetical protein